MFGSRMVLAPSAVAWHGACGQPGHGSAALPMAGVPCARAAAPSQWLPWQPSHPAGSLQCQKINQDDTAALKNKTKHTKKIKTQTNNQPQTKKPQMFPTMFPYVINSPSCYYFISYKAELLIPVRVSSKAVCIPNLASHLEE